MLSYWVIIFLLGALFYVDLARVVEEYQKNKDIKPLFFHGALLLVLFLIVFNSLLRILDIQFELPWLMWALG